MTTVIASKRLEAVEIALGLLKKYVNTPLQGHGSTGGDQGRYGAVCLDKDTGEFKTFERQYPCHAYMKDYHNAIVVFNQYSHRKLIIKDEADLAWFKFITNDTGPWKAFKNRKLSHAPDTKDLDNLAFIWNSGWVWSDLTYPANLQHSFLTAARMSSEWPDLINRWHNWVSTYGVHPALAFIFLDVFLPMQYNAKRFQVKHTNKYDWPVDVSTSGEEYVRNFCNGDIENLIQEYGKSPQYRPVNRIFGVNTLEAKNDLAYPNVLFNLYHETYGNDEEEHKRYFQSVNSGMSVFDYKSWWNISEEEVIAIIKLETQRLLVGATEATFGSEEKRCIKV